MNCPICGEDNREGARYCRMCGVGLPQETPPDGVVAVESEATPGSEPGDGMVEVVEAKVNEASDDEEETADSAGAAVPEPTPEPEAEDLPVEAQKPEGDEAVTVLDEAGADIESEAAGEVELVDEAPDAESPDEPTLDDDRERRFRWELGDIEIAGIGSEVAGEVKPVDEALDAESPVEPALDDEEEDVPAESEPEASDSEETPADIVTETEPEAEAKEPAKVSVPDPSEDEEGPELLPSEGEGLVPVAPGTVIDERYLLLEATEVSEGEILYPAQDLLACWQCGFVADTAGESYCVDCGAALDRRPEVRLLQVVDEEAEPSGDRPVASRLVHEDRFFLLLADAEPEPEAPEERQQIRLLVGQRSDVGQVRNLDEDSLLTLTVAPNYEGWSGPVLGLYAVADGMGGHEGGEVASKLALQVLADCVLRNILLRHLSGENVLEETILVLLEEATSAANDAVYLGRQKRDNDMGTTLTTAFIRDDRVFLAHVGDCRAYRWNADGLGQLTTDHSLVASMIATGQVAPEEIYTHPHRSVIYRCIGDQPVVEVDTSAESLAPGDRIIVCSDGLWEMIRDEGIEEVMLAEADPQIACDILVNHANLAGGDDNISVIVVQIEAM